MKKYIVFFILIFYFYSLSAQRIVSYLGENRENFQFETIDTLSYVLFKKGVTDTQKRKAINSHKNIPIEEQFMLLNINSEDEIAELRKDDNIEAVYRMLRSHNGNMYVLTGDILVKVNPGENVESVFGYLNIPYISDVPIRGLENVFIVRIPSSDQTLDIVNKLMASEMVVYAEPDFIRIIETSVTSTTTENYNPSQWAIKNTTTGFDINVLSAWKISKGENIKVAVLDVGVDLEHPDLKANLLPGYDATDGEIRGWNGGFVPETDGSVAPNNSHGTACAGIIAAVENNIGITGVAPQCKVIPVRIGTTKASTGTKLYTKDSYIANGIFHAYTNGADVLSCSFGIGPVGSTIKNAIAAATTQGRNGRGSVVVAASGNESKDQPSPLSLVDNVISVGSMNIYGQRVSSSNYGNGLKVMAPGESIYTTDICGIYGYDIGDYCNFGGTSAACPHVAGIAALILSAVPDAQASSVASWIYSSCKKLPEYQYSVKDSYGTWNNETGYGLVDAYKAILSTFTLNIPDLLCDCEMHTFTISGSTEKCDTIIWSIPGDILSGAGTDSIEVCITDAPGYAIPVSASLYFGDLVVELKKWVHSGVPETYEITGYDEATAWEYMYVEAIMEGATSYTWTLEKGNCGIWPNGNTAQIMPYDTNPVTICVTGHNQCGSWSEWFNFIPEPRSYMKSRQAVGAKAVAVYTLSYNLVYSDKNLVAPFDIKTTNLSPGFYIIEYQFEDGTATREKVYVP